MYWWKPCRFEYKHPSNQKSAAHKHLQEKKSIEKKISRCQIGNIQQVSASTLLDIHTYVLAFEAFPSSEDASL